MAGRHPGKGVTRVGDRGIKARGVLVVPKDKGQVTHTHTPHQDPRYRLTSSFSTSFSPSPGWVRGILLHNESSWDTHTHDLPATLPLGTGGDKGQQSPGDKGRGG